MDPPTDKVPILYFTIVNELRRAGPLSQEEVVVHLMNRYHGFGLLQGHRHRLVAEAIQFGRSIGSMIMVSNSHIYF